MLDPNLKNTLAKGYAKLGDISYIIALNMRKGKDHVPSQRNLKEQGIKMAIILKVLFRHTSFDPVINLPTPTLWRITEVQVNKLLRCLSLLGELDKYPVVPVLFPNTKPIVISSGAAGAAGTPGAAGTNANIIAQVASGEDQIVITSSVVGLVKTYEFSLVTYIKQILASIITSSKIFEIGTSQTITILITSTKGTRNILTLTCSDSVINAVLQPLVNLIALNNAGVQPVSISLVLTLQTIATTYQFTEYDGKSNILASDSISFYYPFLYGAASTILTNTHYSVLTKFINQKANYGFALNDTDKYFYIMYPSSYGILTKILDQNGFDATSAFTSVLLNVTSSGLAANWTIEYRVYRTTVKTSINGTYQIQF